MKKFFPLLVKICLISVYVIILAGSTVRMTGSGMGCPDWPKCFGHLIPPTDESELLWQPKTEFKKGILIIRNDSLFRSKSNLTTQATFNRDNWQHYTKHDYAKFNVTHTWVEYINRLATVLSGIFFLLLIAASLSFWKSDRKLVLLSVLALVLMGFEAWLGKTVVDSNLAVSKITIHMLVALIIVALLLTLQYFAQSIREVKKDILFRNLVLLAFGLTIAQIVMGIDVREFVDEQLKNLGFQNKALIDLESDSQYLIHRSFSIVVVLLNVWIFLRNRSQKLAYKLPAWIIFVLFVEVLAGVLMSYFDFPFGTQVIHLLFAAILFGLQYYLILNIYSNHKRITPVP